MRLATLILSMALLAAPASARVTSRPLIDTANGSLYLLISPQSWHSAQSEASLYGGDLVTINSFDENELILEAFSDLTPGLGFWTGYSDLGTPDFAWASGEAPGFEFFWPGEPNAAFESAVHVYNYGPRAGFWNDRNPDSSLPGVVEIDLGYSIPGGPVIFPDGSVVRGPLGIPEPGSLAMVALATLTAVGFRRS